MKTVIKSKPACCTDIKQSRLQSQARITTIKESIRQEDIKYLIVHALKTGSKCTRKNLTEMKEDRDRSTVVIGDINMRSFVSHQ